MPSPIADDPFAVLGLARDADEADVRARYLELVRRFPPEREPEKFQEIRAAYTATQDVREVARKLLVPPEDSVPSWNETLDAQAARPPRLTSVFVLSLGNRSPGESVAQTVDASASVPSQSANSTVRDSDTHPSENTAPHE